MPMFAIYYLPPAEHPLYIAGSHILGYDAYTGALLPLENPARAHFQTFDAHWAMIPQVFGFHVTIGHALEYDAAQLPAIERELEHVLNLFDPQKPFSLTPTDEFLRMSGANATLYYHANQPFMMFHAMVIARVHPYGSSTPSYERIRSGEQAVTDVHRHRAERYWHGGILDDWFPHFGLLRPIPADQRENVRSALLAALPAPAPLTVETICLLTRGDDETHFTVYRQFHRQDYPQPSSFGR